MRIYDINPTDRTAINPTGRDAPLDPMRGEPRIPRGATSIAPPAAGEREAARWSSDDWELVPDYRGHVYYTADGQRHEITELGVEPPTDALDEAPPEPLADVARSKRRAIEQSRKNEEDQGVTLNGVRYSGSPDNRQSLRDALDLATENDLDEFAPWKDSDDVFHVSVPVVDIREARSQIIRRRADLIAREKEKFEAIDAAVAAEDRDALNAIEW